MLNYKIKNLIFSLKADNEGATAILLTMLILFSVIGVSLAASGIVDVGLRLARNQTDSTKAYFASEAGAERILWEIRNNPTVPPGCFTSPSKYCFNNSNPGNIIMQCETGCSSGNVATTTLSNGSRYYINYEFSGPEVTISSFGEYGDTRRKLELKY